MAPAKLRSSLAALICGIGCSGLSHAATPDAVSWVEKLYRAEAERHNAQVRDQRDLPPGVISPDTQALREAARKGPGPKLEGPILHIILGWGIFPPDKVTITSVKAGAARGAFTTVLVDLVARERPRSVIVVLTHDCDAGVKNGWCIHDLEYSDGKALRAYLAELAGR